MFGPLVVKEVNFYCSYIWETKWLTRCLGMSSEKNKRWDLYSQLTFLAVSCHAGCVAFQDVLSHTCTNTHFCSVSSGGFLSQMKCTAFPVHVYSAVMIFDDLMNCLTEVMKESCFDRGYWGSGLTGEPGFWDVALPSLCQSIVQLKYTLATQPWTTL